jgi:hypothetical protein
MGKRLSDAFPIQNDLKGGDALSPLLLKFVLEYASRKIQATQEGLKLTGVISIWFMLLMIISWVTT